MLNEYSYKQLNVCTLKILCKSKGIKCSALKKRELFEKYNLFISVKKIQIHFRNYFYKDAVDYITLEPIQFPCFVHKTKTNTFYFYGYDTIIKYIMKTGNTRDPMTREQYSDEELHKLDCYAKYYYPDIKYSSTLKIKQNINYARRICNRENDILSFQMRLDELKNNLILFIESDILILEPMVVDNIEYSSSNHYLNTMLHEMKLVYVNLYSHDQFSATAFKTTIIEQIQSPDKIHKILKQL